MKDTKTETAGAARRAGRGALRPRAISVSSESLVKTDTFGEGRMLPLIVRPAVGGLDLPAWALRNREFIEANVLKHGAILFRDFGLETPEDFGRFTSAAAGELLTYHERSSPRHEVGGNVYTSTDYPADQSIFPHNEHSYCRTLPLKLSFCCLTPARAGGETPVADCRAILKRISPRVRQRFVDKRWMYLRNFNYGFGLPWETVFQTSDRPAVEDYCRRNDIEWHWKDERHLTTRQVRPVLARHPRTGEEVWFNHATFFHVSTLEPSMRDALLSTFGPEELPNNTFYGDGTPIESAVLDELRSAYTDELVSFKWQKGDVLLLDNMLTAHSRRPFEGERRVLFAMTDPYTRDDF